MALVWTLIISVIAATIVGFWLSYAGLHAFAFRAGLRGPEAWAWPASVDLFILAGELGVTISAVRGKTDRIAWAYLTGGAAPLGAVQHRARLAGRGLVGQVRGCGGPAGRGDARAGRAAAPGGQGRRPPAVTRFRRGGGPTPEARRRRCCGTPGGAGNPLSQNQLETRFGLTRAEAKNLYARVIPQTPAAAAPAPSPPGDGKPPRLAMPPAGTAMPSPVDTVPAGPSRLQREPAVARACRCGHTREPHSHHSRRHSTWCSACPAGVCVRWRPRRWWHRGRHA